MTDDPVDPDDLAVLARDAARRAATLLVDGRSEAQATARTKSTSTDMVSAMDHRSEELIVGDLLARRPHDGIVGEEGGERLGTSGVRWIVDPLDGTTNYLYGYPGWAVSIAAEASGRIVAGVVIDPSHGEEWVATVGGGARCNGEPVRLPPPPPLGQALVSTGFGYDPAQRGRQGAVVARLLPHVRDVRRGGAAAVDLCWVGSGRVDAFFERGLQPWDLAAGGLVATEAGAIVSDGSGGPAGTTRTVAAPPPLHDQLVRLLDEAGDGPEVLTG